MSLHRTGQRVYMWLPIIRGSATRVLVVQMTDDQILRIIATKLKDEFRLKGRPNLTEVGHGDVEKAVKALLEDFKLRGWKIQVPETESGIQPGAHQGHSRTNG